MVSSSIIVATLFAAVATAAPLELLGGGFGRVLPHPGPERPPAPVASIGLGGSLLTGNANDQQGLLGVAAKVEVPGIVEACVEVVIDGVLRKCNTEERINELPTRIRSWSISQPRPTRPPTARPRPQPEPKPTSRRAPRPSISKKPSPRPSPTRKPVKQQDCPAASIHVHSGVDLDVDVHLKTIADLRLQLKAAIKAKADLQVQVDGLLKVYAKANVNVKAKIDALAHVLL